jgi:hypothetical protein
VKYGNIAANAADISRVSIRENARLYSYVNTREVRASLEYAKRLPEAKIVEAVNFHFYWRVPREFSRKQALPLKATLVTQRNMRVKVILWSNVDLSSNEYLRPLLPFIETRIWSLEDEISGTPLEHSNILNGQTDDDLCWLGGDLFRLLVLYKYGGVYMDMDTVPLRDFSPIVNHEFMYQWGSSGTTENEPNLLINGAVMRLFAHSELAAQLLKELGKTTGIPNSNSWGKDLYAKVEKINNNWLVLPCSWFDTDWPLPKKNRVRGPFTRNIFLQRSKMWLDGPFAWHWHNQWDATIHPSSKFAIIEKKTDSAFRSFLASPH